MLYTIFFLFFSLILSSRTSSFIVFLLPFFFSRFHPDSFSFPSYHLLDCKVSFLLILIHQSTIYFVFTYSISKTRLHRYALTYTMSKTRLHSFSSTYIMSNIRLHILALHTLCLTLDCTQFSLTYLISRLHRFNLIYIISSVSEVQPQFIYDLLQ